MIEPAAGADRATLAFLVDAYEVEEVEGRQRTVLRLHPRLAPVKVAVLPLVSKEGMPEKAREIFQDLRRRLPAEFDEGGSIGTRTCSTESRSRRVTESSSIVWWSTVIPQGVPISSWRR